jgi:hypothetical protein
MAAFSDAVVADNVGEVHQRVRVLRGHGQVSVEPVGRHDERCSQIVSRMDLKYPEAGNGQVVCLGKMRSMASEQGADAQRLPKLRLDQLLVDLQVRIDARGAPVTAPIRQDAREQNV